MFAKAAASASVLPPKGVLALDSFDIRLIQYKYACYKLQEILRILDIMEKNLKPKEKDVDNNSPVVIPLVNHILSLCQGTLFNVHPIIRKRFNLLCSLKQCKLSEVVPPLSTSKIDIAVQFPNIEADSLEAARSKIYDFDFQWKLMRSLKVLVVNTTSIYNRKMRQLQLERTSSINRPYEVSEKMSPFGIQHVDDLLRSSELTLSLDFAVLIKDYEKDSSLNSFDKLDAQVGEKYINFVKKKVLPSIRLYYNQLSKYSNAIPAKRGSVGKENLPGFEFTLHRTYSLLLKIYNILIISISITREIYIPRKSYFNDVKTCLLSENIYDYERTLKELESFSENNRNSFIQELADDLAKYSDHGIIFKCGSINGKEYDTIVDLYKNSASKAAPLLRESLHLMNSWIKMWKFIRDNKATLEKYDRMSDDQLEKMAEEKRVVDKLSYLEAKSKKNETLPQKISSQSSSVVSSASTSISSSPPLNPIHVINTNDAKHTPISKVTGRQKLSTPSSVITSRRASVERVPRSHLALSPLSRTNSKNLSNSSSPRVSRRPSVVERKQCLPDGANASSNRVTVKKGLTRRPRSASLQSSFSNSTSPHSKGVRPVTNSNPVRSNSLEATAALNRKIVQDTVQKLMNPGNIIGTVNRSRSGSGTLNSKPSTTSQGIGKLSSGKSSSSKMKVQNDIIVSPSKIITYPLSTAVTLLTPPISKLKIQDEYDEVSNSLGHGPPEKLQFHDTDDNNASEVLYDDDPGNSIKRVRFIGVPPMTDAENPRPKRKGWYKKPAVLHYPPIPTQINTFRSKLTQEGIAFRTSLRGTDNDSNDNGKRADGRNSMLFNMDDNIFRESSGMTFASKIRDKLRS